jgi:hypothetical protein
MSDQSFKVKKGLTINPVDPATVTNPEAGDIIIDSTDNNKLKVFSTTSNNFAAISGAGSGTLNLLEDSSFESTATEGSITGGTASLNTVTVLPTPNNKSSLELNFNNVTGSYILEKNTGAQYDSVQGLVSVWIKNAKAGVKLIPRINGADSTALSVDVKTDNKWNEYVIPAVIGTTSFGFKVDVTASNAGSLFIDEATVGAMPATMTPEVAQAEYFGGLVAQGAANCVWTRNQNTFGNFAADADCNEFTEIGNIKKPSTKIPGLVIPAGSPSGTYEIKANFNMGTAVPGNPCFYRLSDGVKFGAISAEVSSPATISYHNHISPLVIDYETSSVDKLIQLQAKSSASTDCRVIFASSDYDNSGFDVYYYPPKNKIYSNKSMGWYVDVNIGGANPSLGTSNVSSYTSISNGSLDMVINPGSQPAQIPCSGTNPSTGITCSAGDEQIGVVFDVPSVGTYEVCGSFGHQTNLASGGSAFAAFQLIETPNNAQTILQEGRARVDSGSNVAGILEFPHKSCAVFNFSSVGKKTIRLMYEQTAGGAINNNLVLGDRSGGIGQRDIHITVKPFINNEQITASFKQYNEVQVPIVTNTEEIPSPASLYVNRGSLTTSIDRVFIWRVGDRLHVRGSFDVTGGSGSGSNLLFTLPNGLVMDTTKQTNLTITNVGTWGWYDNSGSSTVLDDNFGWVAYNTDTTVGFLVPGVSQYFNSNVLATTDRFSFEFNVPIQGWSATQSIREQLGL